MLKKKGVGIVSVEAYLKDERVREVKHEFIEGQAYAMAGASKNHERIALKLMTKFDNHLEGTPCEPFGSDIKIQVKNNYFYPDAMVVCDDKSEDAYCTDSPIIIVEVLSPSTRRLDEVTKRQQYQSLPSLQEYVLIEQDFVKIVVSRRGEGWFPQYYYLGDEIPFKSNLNSMMKIRCPNFTIKSMRSLLVLSSVTTSSPRAAT